MSLNRIIFIVVACLSLFSCQEKKQGGNPIIMGDSTTIVTEDDTHYLRNVTEDISPTNKKSTEGKITSMMMQVDSAKSAQKLEEENSPAPLSGFTINFSECEVVFDGLSAHAIQNNQDERKANSVSYLRDGGSLNEISLQVKGLTDVKVEQRIFTRLSVEDGADEFVLNDLGKFISPWSSLAGKDIKFISLGANSLQFFNVDHNKIQNALDRELRKKRKSRQEIEQWMQLIKRTNSYSDAPCKINMVSGQWRITGRIDGKRVQKLIQFDIP